MSFIIVSLLISYTAVVLHIMCNNIIMLSYQIVHGRLLIFLFVKHNRASEK